MASSTVDQGFSPRTIPGLCLTALRRHAKPDAINEKQAGHWVHIAADAFAARVRGVALGLTELGIRRGDRVALLSENRPEWSIADLAILSIGAVNVPIYTTQAVDQARFILEDSGASALFVSGRKVFKHARAAIEAVEPLRKLIFFDGEAAAGIDRATTFESIEARGAALDRDDTRAYDRLAGAAGEDDLATIIYTSGTTGEPKGVMLTHGNFISNALSISSALPIRADDVALSVLPLSHIFERAAFYIFCWNGVSVYYAASFDQVGDYLREVRPTIMTAVPRLFEKVYHRIIKRGTSAGGWRSMIFSRAMDVGQRYATALDRKELISPGLRIQQALFDRLVFSKWRAGVGGRLRFFVSGGAPLSPALSYAFNAASITILQGFGMTETCIVSANRPDDNRVGSVGLPFPGIDVSIAEDGEILVRGPNVMRGYYNHPAETAAAFRDGWFATGDVGRIDERGHLYITDRKKDLFKLSNGKYVAPQLIESLLKQSALVTQAVVVGAGRKQPVALIVPEWEALRHAMGITGPMNGAMREEISADPAAIRTVQREVAALTAELPDYQRVRRVGLLPEELSIDRGELTPTLKVKRRVIDEKYGGLIEGLYSGAKEQ